MKSFTTVLLVDDETGEMTTSYDDNGSYSYDIIQETDFRGNISAIFQKHNGGAETILGSYLYDQMGRMTYANTGDKNRIIKLARAYAVPLARRSCSYMKMIMVLIRSKTTLSARQLMSLLTIAIIKVVR
ncbi:MAG: hypothetical protein HOJ34_09440 [Kordiimonadaceae bacterium]|nr:hypothetical protein [Kordiimonadaceae bacterium]MBT6329991.1 hypothetical protein [Kordiimonadaceae bacterium]MBT7583021.1 hypothetical protein [Kordiimonadaceae bacterium]